MLELSSLCVGLARIIDVNPSVPIREGHLDGVLGDGNVFDACGSERVGGGQGSLTGYTEKADLKTEVPFDAVA